MDMNEFVSDGFLKVESFNGPMRDIIANITTGRFEKPDMELQGGATLGLNTTNIRTMKAAWGPESNDWIGKEVELYVGKTMFNGQERDSILVRTISPHTAWRTPAGAPAGLLSRKKELDDEIPF